MKKYIAVLFILSLSVNIYSQKKRMILFIGDGFGIAPKTATRMALGQGQQGKQLGTDKEFQIMNLDKLKYAATVTSHSLNSWITDSAPGAVVYACGEEGKIDNEMISINPETQEPIETILEKAKKAGYAVGIVTTARVTHATPAAFASHSWNRDLEDWIAAQMISKNQEEYEAIFNASENESLRYNPDKDWIFPKVKNKVEIDLIMGGGASYFTPKSKASDNLVIHSGPRNGKIIGKGKRTDNVDLIEIAKSRGYEFINSRDELLHINSSSIAESGKKVLALFNSSHLKYEQDRQLEENDEPMLAEMVEFAIHFLEKKSNKGYFLMIESGRIDHLEHANCGGIVVNQETQSYQVTSNKLALLPDNDKAAVSTRYGSDYMIKEVMAYDYAIGKARNLLKENGETFIITTSDHETGGFSVVGISEQNKTNPDSVRIRTYAKEPKKKDFNINPKDIVRGDIETKGWFPEYELKDYQGYLYPEVGASGRRIVIAYGSNPLTNGNKTTLGTTPGNHTPQDILVLSEDNMNGLWASKFTGRGLLDNTQIHPVMMEFLGIK